MKRLTASVCFLATALALTAQTPVDTTLVRVVTVERDYQPAIRNAVKQNLPPAVIQEDIPLNPVVYSTYSEALPVGFNMHVLPVVETTFPSRQPLQGMVDGALGHRNTHFAFDYRTAGKKNVSLDLFARHDAMWGRQTLSNTQLGLQVTRRFQTCEFYFDADGNNGFFSRYGRYFDGGKGLTVRSAAAMNADDWQDSWLINTRLGVRSRGEVAVRYDLSMGYSAYILPNVVAEHQFRTRLNAVWTATPRHSAGLNAYVQDNLYSMTDMQTLHARHAFRLEPFYAYTDNRFRLHAGVNFDFNLGVGEMMSARSDISFAPSPNLSFEWFLLKDILDFYGTAQGSFGTGTLLEFMQTNRYMDYTECLQSDHVDDYTPVDAQLGFKLRPMGTMLFDIYAGYSYQINQLLLVAPLQQDIYFHYSDWQCWKAGAQLHYHWRDILNIRLAGNCYHWICQRIEEADDIPSGVYDRPSWDAHLRVDVRISGKWSLYSDNTFVGSRRAFAPAADDNRVVTLKPVVSLNLGVSYAVNRWLSTYLQLDNYLNRRNDIYYGYQSQGFHFLWGVKYLF